MATGILVKGSGFVQTTEYLADRYGDDTLERIYQRMPADSAKAVRRALVLSMVPVEHVGHLLDAVKGELGAGDPEINFKVSLAAAKANFSTLYKIFFRLGSPNFIIGRAAKVFGRFVNQGQLTVVHSDNDGVDLRLTDFAYQHAEFCNHRLRGWYQAPLELSGCRISQSEHTACVLRGDPHCQWQYRW